MDVTTPAMFSIALASAQNTGHKLRQRTHNLIIPTDVNAVIKQNFVHRTLFRDIFKVVLLFCFYFVIFNLY